MTNAVAVTVYPWVNEVPLKKLKQEMGIELKPEYSYKFI